MYRVPIIAAALLLAATTPARAHRLDELLQATYVAVGGEQTRVELYLYVGAEIADDMQALVDRDRDGSVSAPEQERFAALHLSQLALTVDGVGQPLVLTRYVFPDSGELAAGAGVIRITGHAAGAGRGRHLLVLGNRAAPVTSVYQANALQPQDDAIDIFSQSRDSQQQTLRVDYAVSEAAFTRGAMVWVPFLGGAALIVFRGLERRRARTKTVLAGSRA